MAQASLVEATFDDGKEGSLTAIKREADGQTFLRAFKDHPIPAEATLCKSQRGKAE